MLLACTLGTYASAAENANTLPHPADHRLVNDTLKKIRTETNMRTVMDLMIILQEQAHRGSLEAIYYLKDTLRIPPMCRQPYIYLESAYKGNLQSQITTHKKMLEIYKRPAPQEMKANFSFINNFIKEQQKDAFIENVFDGTYTANSASSSNSADNTQKDHQLSDEYIKKWLTFQQH